MSKYILCKWGDSWHCVDKDKGIRIIAPTKKEAYDEYKRQIAND